MKQYKQHFLGLLTSFLLISMTNTFGQGFVTSWITNDNTITIPTTGSGYNYDITWINQTNTGVGDGSITGQTTNYTVTGLTNGDTYKVEITGDFPRIFFNNTGDKTKIKNINQWGNIIWTSMINAFYGCSALIHTATDAPNLTGVTSMESMFQGCTVLNGDMNNWNTSTITNMDRLFQTCTAFNGDITNWNVGMVRTMRYMFQNTANFQQAIGTWNTSSLQSIEKMFQASKFNQPLNDWNVSNVTNMSRTFRVSSFNKPLNKWNTGKVKNMSNMFDQATKFDQNLGDWNVSNVTSMGNMFNGAKLSVANYDALLKGWSVLTLKTGRSFHAGNSQYCTATAARQKIIDDFNWTINDGGVNCSNVKIYVDINNTSGTEDGTSWATAYTDLQTALDNIVDGVPVWVADGTYLPTESPDETTDDDRNKAFHFSKDILLYGGFAGTETAITDRGPGNETILSGDLNGDDDTGGDNSENAYHVIITTALTTATTIDGFSIAKGNANGSGNITYKSQSFNQNFGAGVHNISSSPSITNTVFYNNLATHGGGMYNYSSSSPVIVNTIFYNNSVTGRGGGMYNFSSSSSVIVNSTFYNNSANNGGGICNHSSSPSITNVTFYSNSSINKGGGIFNYSSPSISNTVFYNNTNSSSINDIHNNGSVIPTGANNASDGTKAPADTGTLITLATDPFTDSSNPAGADGIYGTTDDGLVPLACSPLVDAGSNTAYTGTSEDLAGVTRTFNTTIDIGAYENQKEIGVPLIYVDVNATGANNGTSWTDAYTNLQPALDNVCERGQVWVAHGTYFPTESPDETIGDDRNKAFHFSENILLYGGFAGTETAITDRVSGNETILSGDLNGDDETGGDNSENAYHVIITTALTTATTIDGFSIAKGNADDSDSITYESKNFSKNIGGAMYNISSSPSIINTTFYSNSATDDGGAMYNDESSPSIKNTTFYNNSATDDGGAMYNNESSPSITNTTFYSNSATNDGGAMYNESSSNPSIQNTVFYNNTNSSGTSDIFNNSSTPKGANNASDGTNAPADTGTLISLATDPFTNSSNPAGADGIYGTSDDGLVPVAGSVLINVGDNTKNSTTLDLAGNARFFNAIDIGAYEYSGVSHIYVDINATGANNGTNWTDAYTNLQTALDNVALSGQVWVAHGTYLPTESPDETLDDDRNKAFHFSRDLLLYGGFQGIPSETAITDRTTGYETILSGDLGTLSDTSDNAYHVIITTALTTATTIDGFSIAKGNANGSGNITYKSQSFNQNFGAGVHNISSSPSITNTVFYNNLATHGGGMYNISSSPTIINSHFYNNSATNNGGGMYNNNTSSPTITNSSFTNNSANIKGGGMYNESSSNPSIQNTVFYNNTDNGVTNDIFNDSSTPTGANNASDGTKAPADTGTLISLTTDPFTDSSNPAGTDGIYGTTDDGLVPLACSPLVDAGSNTAYTGTSEDLAGATRTFNTTIDIGAYENQKEIGVPLIYVDVNATGANNGTSWTDAYTNLQPALDNVCERGQVWVAHGTYFPTESPDETTGDDRNKAFHFSENILLYGGFAGTETAITDRVLGNETILSGDLNRDDETGGDNSENAYHVIITTALTTATTIDGFSIAKGNADDSDSITYESKNFSKNIGGAMYNISSSPSIINTTFYSNSATDDGGAMYNNESSPSITNITFYNNSATDDGGAMYNISSSPSIINTTFYTNLATNDGGAMYNESSSNPSIQNTVFYSNTDNGSVNDIFNDSSTPTGANNASDGANAPDTTGTLISLTTDPFTNSSTPAGADGVYGTTDDGLVPKVVSVLLNTGDDTYNSTSLDLAGNARFFNAIDIGAYEYSGDTHNFVNINATGANNGTSWTDAYINLQTALDNVVVGGQVWVAHGTYLPTETPTGSGDSRKKTFHFNKDILLYGGFQGIASETAITDRVSGYETILSGDLGTLRNRNDNALHVIITTALTTATIIDGFSIVKGNASAEKISYYYYSSRKFVSNNGGGMYNISSSPTITNSNFTNNWATKWGGGCIVIILHQQS